MKRVRRTTINSNHRTTIFAAYAAEIVDYVALRWTDVFIVEEHQIDAS